MPNVIKVKEIESTNQLAKQYIETGVAAETVIIAESQTAGKGRLGKSWVSVAGKGLYCSIILKPECPREKLSLITLLTGLVVAEIIEKISGLKAQLKWPNDIILNGKKCAGILCEAVLKEDMDHVIVGIGINLNLNSKDIPDLLRSKVTSVGIEAKKYYEINEIFETVYQKVIDSIKQFEKYGFDPFLEKWRRRDFLRDKKTSWCTVGKEVVLGKGVGLSDTGEYYICDDEGTLHQVLSGDVSLVDK